MIDLPDPLAELAAFVVILLALGLFVWGYWRHDVVALLSALTLAVFGVIPPDRLFTGFGHPAVITVAAVLVVSRGLQNSGLIQILAGWLSRLGGRTSVQVAGLSGLVALCSAFMNNVGALALFLPVALRLARKTGTSPSVLLMPIAFASLLGGMVTLIGTPPNIIIATFRADSGADPFGMFDFAPVGLGVTLLGVAFIALVGWRLIPAREKGDTAEDLFRIQEYMTEVRVPEGSPMVGQPLTALAELTDGEIAAVAIVRGDRRVPAPLPYETMQSGDVLVLRADSTALEELGDGKRFDMVGEDSFSAEVLSSDDVSLIEAVVRPDSPMIGRSVGTLALRWRHGVNLLAIARRGARLSRRLSKTRLEPGDVLLLQIPEERAHETLEDIGCLPLAERELAVGRPRRLVLGVGLFGGALALTVSGLLPVPVAFSAGALAMIMTGLIPAKEVYESVDWPVIVLLGAMIPVGEALESTGGAHRIGGYLLELGSVLPPAGTLAVLLVGTMFLSDLVNNAAAVVLMAPIGLTVAAGLDVSADPFLMAIAVGGSAAFLTPIGHQSNILVMGPGGYRFGDYWRMGLPLEAATVVVALPLILYFWPL